VSVQRICSAAGNEMAISRRKDRAGKITGYQVVVSVPDPLTGKTVRHTLDTYRLWRDADKAERKAKDEIQRGTFTLIPPEPVQVLTVADVVDVWYQTKRGTIQSNSANGYESVIRLHLLPALGMIPVLELTHDDVQRQVNRWRAAGMGAQLIHRCMLVLRASLARQVKTGKLPFNVAIEIEKPSVRKRRALTIWTPNQMTAFLEAVQSNVLFPFWHLTLLEGMRRSEALGLRWSDVRWNADETAATAHIVQTVIPDHEHGGKALIQARTKTNTSARSVVLTAGTIAALKVHRDRQRFQKLKLVDVWGDHDLIVTNAIGGVVNPSVVKTNRIRLMEAAGVPQVTTHDLRHFAATVMLTAGTAPVIVAQKIGHSSVATTADIYGHVMPSDQSSANDAMAAYLARATAKATGTDDAWTLQADCRD
jgi:integrase